MAENQVYLIKSGQNSFVEETQAIVGISGGKVGIGTTVPEADFHVSGDAQIDGDLTVRGNFTTVESTTIQVDDKNIELGVGSTSDTAANGGGITLHGATNKTFNWLDATDAWTSSEHLHLANGKHFSADELRALDADGLKLADQTASGILIKGGKVGIHQASPAYDLDVAGSGNFDSLYIQGNSVLTGDGSIFGKWEDAATAGEIYYNLGNVGVGTIDPSAKLHVVGTTFLNGDVSASTIKAIDAGGLTLGDDAGNGIFVEDGGQVGVNIITPNYNLHVNGTAHVGDNFSVGGDISVSAIKAIDANGLTLGDDAGNGIFVEDGGQVGVGTSDPSVKLEVVGDSLFNGDLSVGSAFSVSTNGSVGGILPTSAGQVVGWDGSKWRPITSAGGGGSSSEVPEAFIQSLASGQSEYTINFTQTYDSAPAISTDLQIDGVGDIIPYAISEVTTSGYSISFAKDLPNDNYKIHTNFGGRDVFWTTGALGSINYSGGDVSIQDSLSVGANLTVQGNAVLTGSAADLGKWDEGAGSEIYYSDGNVGVGTSNPSYTLHVNGTIYNENGGVNVANKFNVSTLGAVGGQSPAFNEVIKWDGSKWVAGSAPGGGAASSSEVPSAFDTWLSAGSTLHPITFVDAPEGGYQSIPSISTDVEIVDGDIIPYAISGVSTTGYYAVFSDPIPTANNYKIHTTFGGKEVYWKTGAGGSSIYYDGDSVSVDDLVVGGNLTVNGTTTTVNTETVEIEDHNLVIAANTGYNQLTTEYPGAGGAYAGILWGTGDAGQASPVSLTYQTNKGFAFEGGNVGIGTKDPGATRLSIRPSGDGQYALQVKNSGGTDRGGFYINSDNGAALYLKDNSSNDDIRLDTNGISYLNGGNVGIGTTNPGYLLDLVQKDGGLQLQMGRSNTFAGTAWMGADSNGFHLGVGAYGTGNTVADPNGFTVDTNGNIGIGTANPNTEISTDVTMLQIEDNNLPLLKLKHQTGGSLEIYKTGAGDTRFDHNEATQLTISSGGNVGIGTTNPASTFSVLGPTSHSLIATFNAGTGGTARGLHISTATTGDASNDIVIYDCPVATGTHTFQTNSTERMRIDRRGNVGIGTTNPLWTFHPVNNVADDAISRFENISSSPYGIQIKYTSDPDNSTSNWFLDCKGGNTSRFVVYSDGDAWTTDSGVLSSDERLKTNIVDATPKLEDIKKLKVRNFEWIPEFHPAKVGEKKIGFIAQELEQVFPGLVDEHDMNLGEEEISRKSVRLGALIPILVKGMQEQQQIIEDLKSQNESLAAQNADFESRISQLEQ